MCIIVFQGPHCLHRYNELPVCGMINARPKVNLGRAKQLNPVLNAPEHTFWLALKIYTAEKPGIWLVIKTVSAQPSRFKVCSLVPRPRGRREKWPGIHCLRMREQLEIFCGRVRLWTSYMWLLCGEIREITKLDIQLAVWQLCLRGNGFHY